MNKGFSLVELIVVIAIMAILAAVAVAGFSVYIPKAQKQSDMNMLADIQYGVELQSYTTTLVPGDNGYILIKKAGGVEAGGTMQAMLVEALKATYGENYANELKVAYPDWESATLNVEAMTNITNSSYYGKTDELLDKVQTLTNALKDYYGDGAGSQAAANEATLLIASNAGKVNNDLFISWWKDGVINSNPANNGSLDQVGVGSSDEADDRLKFALAAMYARGEAFVQYLGCAGCSEAFNGASAALAEVDKDTALTALEGIMNAVQGHISGADDGQPCDACANKVNDYFTTRAATDAKAYLALMGQIDSMSEDIRTNGDMNSDNLYQSDFIVDTIGSYENTANAFANARPQAGDIMIVVTVDKNGALVFKNYPMDY